MKMKMFLLASAVALLVHPAVVSPRHVQKSDIIHHNLKRILDLAVKCNASLTEGVFVEDVSHLVEGRSKCEDKFFCKVHDILHNKEDVCKREDKESLVRTLHMYNRGRNVQCENTLEGITGTGNEVGSSALLDHIKKCVRRRNFRGTQK